MSRLMRKTILAFLAVLLIQPAPIRADRDGERAALARLIHELELLEGLVSEAERQADPGARRRFQYGWLRQDLDRIALGVREHLDVPRREPRDFPPLKVDYRR